MTLILVGQGLNLDGRWNRWGKLIRGPEDIDLVQSGGYALRGPFAPWGTVVSVKDGAYLVFASETGSRTRHPYSYRCVNDRGEPVDVDWDAVQTLPEEFQAKAMNSPAYAIAADLWVRFQTSRERLHPWAESASPVETLWQQIQTLPEPDRAALFGRVLQNL